MIAYLVVIYFVMFVYGMIIGKFGAAGFSLFMGFFMLWANKQLQKRDSEYNASPRSAVQPPNTHEILVASESECMRSKL